MLQIFNVGAYGWEYLSLPIDFLRAVAGFVLVAYIPGVLLLRIMRLHELGDLRTIFLAVGLSLALVMITGVLINFIYPYLGVFAPFSPTSIVPTFHAMLVLLCMASYIRDRKDIPQPYIDTSGFAMPLMAFLVSIFLFTIAGTVLINNTNDNLLVVLIICVVAFFFILVSNSETIDARAYPIIIFFVSLCLLLRTSLISSNLVGYDDQIECFLSQRVLTDGQWDPSLTVTVNGMLSIVVLAPLLSIVCGIDIVWIIKVAYPVIFALVPVAIYWMISRETDNRRLAIVAVFLFISVFTFYEEMVTLARQEIAEFFMVALLVIILQPGPNSRFESFFLVLFGFMLVVSHYGLFYIFLVMLLCVWVAEQVLGKKTTRLNIRYLLLYAVFAQLWYTYTAGGINIGSLVSNVGNILRSISGDLFSPVTAQGAALITKELASPMLLALRLSHLVAQGLIVIGVFYAGGRRGHVRLTRGFSLFSAVSLLMMIAAIGLPFFASSFNTTRLYHIGLVFLAPYCFIGASFFVWSMHRVLRRQRTEVQSLNAAIKGMSVFLAFFLLVNTGALSVVLNEQPVPVFLDTTVDGTIYNEVEGSGANWLYDHCGNRSVYSDSYRWPLMLRFMGLSHAKSLSPDINSTPYGSYVYLGWRNIANNEVLIEKSAGDVREFIYVSDLGLIDQRSRIFDNGGSQIYY